MSFHPSELPVTVVLSTSKKEISEPFKTKIKVEIIFSCINNLTKTSRYSRTYISKSAGAGSRGLPRKRDLGGCYTDHLIQWARHDAGNICSLISLQKLLARNFPLFAGFSYKTI